MLRTRAQLNTRSADVLLKGSSCSTSGVRRITHVKETIIENKGTKISYQLRDIYSICRCWWKDTTYKWKNHNWKISNFLSCRKILFTITHCCQFLVNAIAVSSILYFKIHGIYVINIVIKL